MAIDQSLLQKTGFSYISQEAARVLVENGVSEITGPSERLSTHFTFPEGTQYEQDGHDHNFTLPCGCHLKYIDQSLTGADWNNKYYLVLYVGTFCSSHDELTDGQRSQECYRMDAMETFKGV